MVLNGIDIASWQSGINVGTNGVAADFVIIKATGGTGYVNPDCDRAFQQAIKSGKKVAVYHYAHELGFQGTAQQEADFFLKNVQGYIGKAILVLDWESDNKGDVTWAKAWLDHVQSKTGVKPLFYTYTAVLNSYNFSSIANADYGLWVANYGSDAPQGYSQPNPPASPYWKSTAMYQYTSNGRLNGWGGRLDLNVFYGDKKAWDAYAGVKSSGSTQKPSTPAPSKPSVDPTTAGGGYSILQDPKFPQNKAHLDRFGPVGTKLVVEGWHTTVSNHEFIIIMDRVKNKELARKEVKPIARPDVKKAFGLSYDQVGFKTEFDLAPLKGHSVIVLMRATNDPKGNTAGGFQDFYETRWYHDIK
ncbi:GH25 family lysozyme [Enterococcus avium]|uniref:GH25 family lysozyme n=1 Tax=Enterococcus avium TaxID=33945 RepID=UPI003DA522B2